MSGLQVWNHHQINGDTGGSSTTIGRKNRCDPATSFHALRKVYIDETSKTLSPPMML